MDINVVVTSVAKFYHAVTLELRLRHPAGLPLEAVTVAAPDGTPLPSCLTRLDAAPPGEQAIRVQALAESASFPDDALVTFRLGGADHTKTLGELSRLAFLERRTSAFTQFDQAIRRGIRPGRPSLLDLGGRARSGNSHRGRFGDVEHVVLDVVEAEDVDVVCDAHEMSRHLEPDYFDFVLCVSVFEHLMMPWKVVLEMNAVMRPGGMALIHTHQCIGMHDLPWDFFRFSAAAWDGLFNDATGFRVVHREMEDRTFIIPSRYEARVATAEGAAGFESSTVLVEKVGPTRLRWDVDAGKLARSLYPRA